MMRQTLGHVCDAGLRWLPLPKKPCRYHGQWLWLEPSSWHSVSSAYEPYMATALRTHLKAGDTMLDVGAHHGLWTLYAAHLVGASGRVVAIEPSEAYAVLSANTAPYPQILALKTGAGRVDGESVFFGQGGGTTGSFVRDVTEINSRFYTVPIEGQTVPIQQLDTIVARYGLSPAVVKIDVEGFEGDVLDGAERLLSQRPTLLIEIHPPQLELSGGSAEKLLQHVSSAGYDVAVIDRNPNSLYTILATPRRSTS